MGKKIVFIGGGSPYIPVIVGEILSTPTCFDISEIVFISRTKKNVLSISEFCTVLLKEKKVFPRITVSTSVGKNISEADVIFLIYRVGGLDARKLDESLGIDLDIICQESQGVGGFSSALRNIYLLSNISKDIKKFAPNAIVFCLTNPTGIITNAAITLGLNAIGVCDAPYALEQSIAKQVDAPYDDLQFDYIGLNHLGWITDVYYKDKSILGNIINHSTLSDILCLPYNITVTDDYIDFVCSIKAIPSSYLGYYYYKREIVEEQKNCKRTRAADVENINQKLYKHFQEKDLNNWPQFFQNLRSGYMLGESVAKYICDLFGNSNERRHIICVKNNNIIRNISQNAVVEVPVTIAGGEVVPVFRNRNINGNIFALMSSVSEYEQLTVRAGLSGNKEIAILALASHPLVGSIDIAVEMFNRILDVHREFLPQFEVD